MTAYTEDDILGALDDAQDSETWPDFEHLDYDILAARLTAYRDEERWAVIFSTIQWDPASDSGIVVMASPIGNCVELPDADEDEDDLAGRIATAELEIDTDDDALEELGYVSAVRVRRKKIPVSKLNIGPDPDVDREGAFWVALAAAEKHRDDMFPNGKELARFFPDGMPPQFLVLDAWHHSKWGLASEWEAFRLLAEAIVQGDASLYRPTEEPNTHWRNWVDK